MAEELVARALAGERVALVVRRGHAAGRRSGPPGRARALAAGCAGHGAPRAERGRDGARRLGLAAEGYAFRGWVPRAAGERARLLTAALAAPLPSVHVRVAAPPRRHARDLARLAPEHPVAVAAS